MNLCLLCGFHVLDESNDVGSTAFSTLDSF